LLQLGLQLIITDHHEPKDRLPDAGALGHPRLPLAAYVVWPLALSLIAKTCLATVKFRFGRRLNSASLIADAWNDAMDTVSAMAALIAVGLTLSDPARFNDADRYGGFVVGLIVVVAGVRVSPALPCS
jgi:divalent metal cation (Fe/Co/Zn/Cd) transporter